MLPGIDVSSFQQAPGRWMPLAGKIEFAAVKVSELSAAGSYVDPDAAADWAALGKAGLGRLGYLFAHPAMGVTPTVDLFLSALRPLGLDDGDAVAVDLEVSSGLSSAAVSGWAQDVCGLLERETGRKAVLYTFLDFALEGNCAGLGGYPLWIADPSSPAGKPHVPAPWTSWSLHQYSQSPMDRDVANYPDLAAMKAALGKPAPRPPRRTEPMQISAGTGYTAVNLPDSPKHVLLGVGSDSMTVRVQFLPGGAWVSIVLTAQDGAQRLAVPAGATLLRVQRTGTAAAPPSIDVALEYT